MPPQKVTSAAKSPSLRAYLQRNPRAASLASRAKDMIAAVGPSTSRMSKSQISFRRRRGFAWLWAPQQYLGRKSSPLAITLAAPLRIRSRRWKEVVTPRRGWYVHHLELRGASDLDSQVHRWLRLAWESAA